MNKSLKNQERRNKNMILLSSSMDLSKFFTLSLCRIKHLMCRVIILVIGHLNFML